MESKAPTSDAASLAGSRGASCARYCHRSWAIQLGLSAPPLRVRPQPLDDCGDEEEHCQAARYPFQAGAKQVPLNAAVLNWRIRHQAVVDMQRQCGNAALFRTRAPYERSFPYHEWVVHVSDGWMMAIHARAIRTVFPPAVQGQGENQAVCIWQVEGNYWGGWSCAFGDAAVRLLDGRRCLELSSAVGSVSRTPRF